MLERTRRIHHETLVTLITGMMTAVPIQYITLYVCINYWLITTPWKLTAICTVTLTFMAYIRVFFGAPTEFMGWSHTLFLWQYRNETLFLVWTPPPPLYTCVYSFFDHFLKRSPSSWSIYVSDFLSEGVVVVVVVAGISNLLF